MKVLLIAMPDTVSALDAVTQIPSLGLCSIAGNLSGCEVKVIDLVFHKHGIRKFVQGLIRDFQPDIVGLSAMSHQYSSSCRISEICRETGPGMKIVLGGYHASLMYQEIGSGKDARLFDFIVRGEGEITFQRLVEEIGNGGKNFSNIQGLSFWNGVQFIHNPDAPLLDLNSLKLPDRTCRVLDKARFLGRAFDCVETSRGCTMDCHFCSIQKMYGRSLREFPLERVINELKYLKELGVSGVFFVDDNITLNVPRLKKLCELIISHSLNTLSYVTQASVPGIASDPDLPALLRRAGFKWVFLGIESGISRNLESMGKKGILSNARLAVKSLQEQGICVFGGFIIGHPQDREEDILSTYKYALDLGVDHPIIQCLTPYPETRTRDELLAEGLITNKEDFSLYNGFTCNVRTRNLNGGQLSNAMFRGGLGLYFNPGYLARSRFWRYSLSIIPALLWNNFAYLAGAMKGKVFISRHSW
jgi:anaerobic magnesium-protoporphyrin IX monomethyl ester cyclase